METPKQNPDSIGTGLLTCVRILRGAASVLAVGFALAGCQATQKTVSLEEAKKITATFTHVAPPPKTFDDVKLLLDNTPLTSAAEHAKNLALMKAPTPTGLAPKDLAEYYLNRGLVAGDLGLMVDEEKNLLQALEIAETASLSYKRLSYIHTKLGYAQFRLGHLKSAIESLKKANSVDPKNIRPFASLTSFAMHSGDIKTARTYADRVHGAVLNWKGNNDWGKFLELEVDANVADTEGRWEEAARLRQRQLDAYDAMTHDTKMLSWRLSIQRMLIQELTKAGKLFPAEIAARDALKRALAAFGKDSGDTAELVVSFSSVLIAQGRFAEAAVMLDEADKVYKAIGSPRETKIVNLVLYKQGVTLAANGQWRAAMTKFDEVTANMGEEDEVYQARFCREVSRALAMIKVGRADEALKLLTEMTQRRTQKLGEKHQSTAQARGLLALALVEAKNPIEAFNHFRKATPILLSRSRESDSEGSGLNDKLTRVVLEGYVGLLASAEGASAARGVGMNPADEAFVVANAARARKVQTALASSAARATTDNPELAEFIRREQDAKMQVSALYGAVASMMNAPPAEQNETAIEDMRVRIDDLRAARAALMEEIESQFPDYAQIINPKPATVETVRANLHAGEALVSFLVAEKAVYSWAIPKTGEVAFARSPVERMSLGDMVNDLRAALDPKAATLGDIPEFDVALAGELYDVLLKPIEKGWKNAKSLLVANDGVLGQLPLAVLPNGAVDIGQDKGLLFARYRQAPWLIRTHAISYLPSPAALLTLRAGKVTLPPNRRAFAGFADPFFNAEQAAKADGEEPPMQVALRGGLLQVRGLPLRRRAAPASDGANSFTLKDLPRLSDTGIEVASIALALKADPTRDIFTGLQASEKLVKEMDLSDRKVIAFATHGLIPGELNGLSEPALALSDPAVSGGLGEDGLLTMSEIMSLRLNADWVVLSACNTASGQGAEAVSGLGSAFFYAGARAILATGWPVETTSARSLTTKLFALQSADASLERSQALRLAMLYLIDKGAYIADGKSVFAYAHPIFWAPFILVGEGGGN